MAATRSAGRHLRPRHRGTRVPRVRCYGGRADDKHGASDRLAARVADDDGRRQSRRRLPARSLARGASGRRAGGPGRLQRGRCRQRRLRDAGHAARRSSLAVGSAYDVIFDVARTAIAELSDVASLAEETSSWPYRHDLDLTGFHDLYLTEFIAGTENPTLTDAPELVLVPRSRHDVRRVQRGAAPAVRDAREHGGPRRRHSRRAHALHAAADGRLLLRPVRRRTAAGRRR